MLQDRRDDRALYYAVSQGVGLALIASNMGDCSGGKNNCGSNRLNRYDLGLGVLLLSRIIEIVDSSYFAIKNNQAKPVQSYLKADQQTSEFGISLQF
jgi:hypothetical protein